MRDTTPHHFKENLIRRVWVMVIGAVGNPDLSWLTLIYYSRSRSPKEEIHVSCLCFLSFMSKDLDKICAVLSALIVRILHNWIMSLYCSFVYCCSYIIFFARCQYSIKLFLVTVLPESAASQSSEGPTLSCGTLFDGSLKRMKNIYLFCPWLNIW